VRKGCKSVKNSALWAGWRRVKVGYRVHVYREGEGWRPVLWRLTGGSDRTRVLSCDDAPEHRSVAPLAPRRVLQCALITFRKRNQGKPEFQGVDNGFCGPSLVVGP
jgi:hypothetical protein